MGVPTLRVKLQAFSCTVANRISGGDHRDGVTGRGGGIGTTQMGRDRSRASPRRARPEQGSPARSSDRSCAADGHAAWHSRVVCRHQCRFHVLCEVATIVVGPECRLVRHRRRRNDVAPPQLDRVEIQFAGGVFDRPLDQIDCLRPPGAAIRCGRPFYAALPPLASRARRSRNRHPYRPRAHRVPRRQRRCRSPRSGHAHAANAETPRGAVPASWCRPGNGLCP